MTFPSIVDLQEEPTAFAEQFAHMGHSLTFSPGWQKQVKLPLQPQAQLGCFQTILVCPSGHL